MINLKLASTLVLTTMLTIGGNPLSQHETYVVAEMAPFANAEMGAKQAVTDYFLGQKTGNVDEMLNNSHYVLPIANLREMYSHVSKDWSLISATITDIKAVNDTLALVSYVAKYKDKIFICTSPVYKQDGQWKLITGLPPATHIKAWNHIQKDTNSVSDVEKTINSYFTAAKEGNIEDMMKYHKDLFWEDATKLREHLERMNDSKLEEGKIRSIHLIGENFVLATLETQYSYGTSIETVPIYKDKDGWKLVFGRRIVKDAIPVGENPTEIE